MNLANDPFLVSVGTANPPLVSVLPLAIEPIDETHVRWQGQRWLYFAGCDYYRLSQHPSVLNAAREGLARLELNTAASRFTSGNHPVYRQLEVSLTRFFCLPKALVTSNGYLTNLTVAQGMAGRWDHVFIDDRAHVALQEAAEQLEAPCHRFSHRDSSDLARKLGTLELTPQKTSRRPRIVLLSDGMFSHDGSVAPLDEYRTILPKSAWIWVDDAHGAGLLGIRRRGTPEYCGITRDRLIQTVTFSKALGTYGGAILSSSSVIREILTSSRIAKGNTPLPPVLASATLESLRLLQTDQVESLKLLEAASEFKTSLRTLGWEGDDHPGPIVAVDLKEKSRRRELRKRLIDKKIFPSWIQYPGGPANGYFRFVISSRHTATQLRQLLKVLAPCWSS